MGNLKDIGNAVDETVKTMVMDQRVSPLVVAEDLVETIRDGVEHKDVVSLASQGD